MTARPSLVAGMPGSTKRQLAMAPTASGQAEPAMNGDLGIDAKVGDG
ncbi:hypothetical protein KBZ15_10885 [Cyanobium sp. BA20m-p-22]|nr:hypothetical protein [Cyanobium sp. BA20m-p-22]MCP9910405.1 hypothetical protein [Cyanobium sp. BA20m-p-22]